MDMKTAPLSLLNDPSLLKTDALVNGHWVKGASRFDVHDPATGKKLADVANLGPKDAEAALAAELVALGAALALHEIGAGHAGVEAEQAPGLDRWRHRLRVRAFSAAAPGVHQGGRLPEQRLGPDAHGVLHAGAGRRLGQVSPESAGNRRRASGRAFATRSATASSGSCSAATPPSSGRKTPTASPLNARRR